MNKNYKLINDQPLASIKSHGYIYEHVSGAKILYLKSDDDNKIFSAAFKTPPEDDAGLPHILEHCVLNGSKKYPIKDPFNELAKSSLYTFLNAMTYPDKTIYPIGSCNDKDFLNLMDVYLDAVFFPAIHDRDETFLQEGWHYQLESPEDELKYNGIVYNEMKGAYSDPYDLLETASSKALFPDTCYAREAGGNPEAIPHLTYEQLKSFHKKYYHPENALIFFYGNMDIEDCFEHLDREYLSKFEKTGQEVKIEAQKPFSAPVDVTGEYSIADEELLGKNYLSAAWVLPEDMSVQEITGFKVLQYILMATPASPLYKALVESGIGEDINGGYGADAVQGEWGVTVKNASVTAGELGQLICQSLEDIVKNGLDKNFVSACLNFIEFQAREEDYGHRPKGLVYNLSALGSWLYDKCPFERLDGLRHLMDIRRECIDGRYLEGLITKYLLANNHRAYVTLTPVLDLDGKMEDAVAARLSKIKAGMSEAEIEAIIDDYKRLRNFQEAEDSEEATLCIPLLKISDVKKEAAKFPLTDKGGQVLHSPQETNGILYSTMFFDTKSVALEHLPLIRILQYIISKTATQKYSNQELTEEIKGNLGGLNFAFDMITKDAEHFMPYAVVSAKALAKNAGKIFEIIAEIIYGSLFDDKSLIKNYVLELKAGCDNAFITSGNTIATRRAAAYFSKGAAYGDAAGGVGFYDYLCALLDNFDSRFEALGAELKSVANAIYNRDNVIYSITCNDELFEAYEPHRAAFHKALNSSKAIDAAKPALAKGPEAFIAASKVQYVVQAAYYAGMAEYSGAMRVLASILDNYLYSEIRVKGGAYGYNASFTREGGMYFGTYRDPHLENSLDVFKNTAKFTADLDISERELHKFILGTIRPTERPLTPAAKGMVAAVNHISGITDEARQKERYEVLAANVAQLREFAGLVEKCLEQGHVCVVGSEAAISKNEGIFDSVRKV